MTTATAPGHGDAAIALDQLARTIGLPLPQGLSGATARIAGLTADSRAVAPGFLFAALPGSRTDGRAHIGDA
ncbi:MAG: UDP-N-acetylmuramoyl-L-alanyl-D-glutamate--2,6-diaminopimelate ligase, partial [Escherichia coli]